MDDLRRVYGKHPVISSLHGMDVGGAGEWFGVHASLGADQPNSCLGNSFPRLSFVRCLPFVLSRSSSIGCGMRDVCAWSWRSRSVN